MRALDLLVHVLVRLYYIRDPEGWKWYKVARALDELGLETLPVGAHRTDVESVRSPTRYGKPTETTSEP